MENIFNRLQFLRHEEIFPTREDAYTYVLNHQIRGDYPTVEDASNNLPTLFGEPMVLLYESEDAIKGPNVILAIGSVGKGTADNRNRTFFIDTQKTEDEIKELDIKIEYLSHLLNIVTLDSDTIKLSSEKTDEGTIISGDVKIADYRITDGSVDYNIIQKEGNKGIYAFVDMDYNPGTSEIKFRVNGITKEFQLPADQHLVKGWYDPREESIFFKLADGSQVKVLVTKLIEEWTVLPDGHTINEYNISGQTVNFSPIVLTKTHVGSKATEHEGIYEWQDVLEADIRVADHITDNILHKDRTGRYLYVKGSADNIKYKDGLTVKDALDNADTKVSTSTGNLIYKRPDGIYAAAMIDYKTAENKLIYTYSDGNSGEIKEVEFKLNSVKVLEDITYDPLKEVIVIRYIDAQGEYQRVEIPVADIIEEWDVNNAAHNILLNKHRSEGKGKDILSADAKIHKGDNNILEDLNHELYVNGIAYKIKYDVTGETTVKDAIDDLSGTTDLLGAKLDQEIADRVAGIERLDNTIGSGFTDDPHENVTYKFEQLQNQVNDEADKLQNEIDRSTSADTEHDERLNTIDGEIGEGFGPGNTVRDEIDALSAASSSRLTDVINEDKSINVETRNDGSNKPTIKVVKVNLSEEVEDNKENIIKLNADGLYAGVDLIYEFNEEVGTNQLIFKTTNGTKVYDLKTNSVVDKIYYDPTREAIIIEYTVNGHRMPDVVIPVGDLINEWRVDDGHDGAIQLEKVRVASGTSEQDILKASAVISDHSDNILVNDSGSLYVSNSGITANKEEIDALKGRMDAVEDDVDSLSSALNDEIARATREEGNLDRKIDAEIQRATSKEGEIINSLNEEITRSTQKDTELTNAISEESLRSIEKDGQLETSLTNEIIRAMSAETALQTSINNETARATGEESRIEHLLNDEVSRSTQKDTELQGKIDTVESNLNDEIARTNQLSSDLAAETSRATLAEQNLTNAISGETQRATSQEEYLLHLINDVENSVDAEEARAIAAEGVLSGAINTEKSERIAADNELRDAIRDITLTFDDTSSIDFTKSTGNVVTADVKLQDGENIIKLGEGLYASVALSYDGARNTIKLVTSNGEQEAIQLNTVGSLIDGIEYNPDERVLVIKYHDAAGNPLELTFPANQLFNDWEVNNLSEKSAIELTKSSPAQADDPDKLSARVLITDDRDGDGKPDAGSDNLIEIRNNGLYVNGSAISSVTENVECMRQEMSAVEKAIFGNQAIGDCGEGFVYEAPNGSVYINSAVTVNNATYILDQSIKQLSSYTETVDNNVNIVSAKTDCVSNELKTVENKILGVQLHECGEGDRYTPNAGTNYISDGTSFNNVDVILDGEIKKANDNVETLSGKVETISGDVECVKTYTDALGSLAFGEPLQNCGEGASYPKTTSGCVISAATSLYDADVLLDRALCDILGSLDILSSDTTTNKTTIELEANGKRIKVDSRLSHGNGGTMTDEELKISNAQSDEFTNTNALRIVDISGSAPDFSYNGLYLSNVWDSGSYEGEVQTYDYSNSVRQNDQLDANR